MRQSTVFLLLVLMLSNCIGLLETTDASKNILEDYWVDMASMQQARGALGVIALNNKIYAIGGALQCIYNTPSDSWQIVGTNEEYNPATNNWTTKTSMPTPRAYFSIATYANKIYCFGGIGGVGMLPHQDTEIMLPGVLWSNITEVYDPATDTWAIKASMPMVAQCQLSIVVVDGLMYFIGGHGVQPALVYDPVTAVWLSLNSSVSESWNKAALAAYIQTGMSKGDGQFSSAYVGGNIYAVSSSIFVPSSGALFIYNLSNGSWRLGAATTSRISGRQATVTSGCQAPVRIYYQTAQANHIYNPLNDSWQNGTAIQTPRFDFGLATLDDRLYAIGGFLQTDLVSGSAKNEQYTPFGYTPSPEPTLTPQPEPSFSIHIPTLAVLVAIVVGTVCFSIFYHRKNRMRQKNVDG